MDHRVDISDPLSKSYRNHRRVFQQHRAFVQPNGGLHGSSISVLQICIAQRSRLATGLCNRPQDVLARELVLRSESRPPVHEVDDRTRQATFSERQRPIAS